VLSAVVLQGQKRSVPLTLQVYIFSPSFAKVTIYIVHATKIEETKRYGAFVPRNHLQQCMLPCSASTTQVTRNWAYHDSQIRPIPLYNSMPHRLVKGTKDLRHSKNTQMTLNPSNVSFCHRLGNISDTLSSLTSQSFLTFHDFKL
jgi:hypothetical protein